MLKFFVALFLLFTSIIVSGDKAVMGYFATEGPYNDIVIVYQYFNEDGTISFSHCRTEQSPNLKYAFSNRSSLNINTCEISYDEAQQTPALNTLY